MPPHLFTWIPCLEVVIISILTFLRDKVTLNKGTIVYKISNHLKFLKKMASVNQTRVVVFIRFLTYTSTYILAIITTRLVIIIKSIIVLPFSICLRVKLSVRSFQCKFLLGFLSTSQIYSRIKTTLF